VVENYIFVPGKRVCVQRRVKRSKSVVRTGEERRGKKGGGGAGGREKCKGVTDQGREKVL
jgi:hypothetical protein